MAHLLFLGAAVRHAKLLPLDDFAFQEDQGPVQVYKKGLRFFFKGAFFWSAFGTNRYGTGKDHPLAAAASRFGTNLKWAPNWHANPWYGSDPNWAIAGKIKYFNE